ncbi:hypothetical protein MANES_12G102533v8 [Manihot esculenta]|uniref:Uncharacterized protein n=1 Tax=Manihot esculenta TaxID=3983 RepID=A0ACB7GRH3_MANES|nr:hypothetical protein MANES_12G102533v8 [Manihot esculenta]
MHILIFSEAIKSSETPFWKEEIKAEIDSITQNGTWTLVDLSLGGKPIGCKWIFKTEYNSDGSIVKYKFFLNGDLEEEIYMVQPDGCIVSGQENKVCKLLKSLYGLKQAPKQKNRGDSVAQSEYAQIIGSLLHLINFSQHDIAYVVCRVSRYTHNPNNDHWAALVRLMKYLRGTMNYGILYSGFFAVLEGYSDANWISNSNEIKSNSGYVFTLEGGAFTWKSTKQNIIAKSTMESEFIALELAGIEAEWLRNFLANIPLGIKPTPSVLMRCDCQVAIAIVKNKTFNGKKRYICLRHNVIKQLLKDGTISIDYVKSEVNLADLLTKPLGRKLIDETSRRIGLEPI